RTRAATLRSSAAGHRPATAWRAISGTVRRCQCAGALALLLPIVAGAQGIRIQGTTWMQFVDLRPLVPVSTGFVSGDRVSSAPVLQDLTMSAWGLGAGISAHAHLRART